MYSSALFLEPDDSLERAQVKKLDRICRKLDLKPSDHLLEIGTGWGGLAIHAAAHYGCRGHSPRPFSKGTVRLRASGGQAGRPRRSASSC